ncbi:hypothetical protein GCM10023174_10140 [Chelativorans composti]
MALIPEHWMPNAPMKRIIAHWTAGGYVASSLDKEHYHFLVEGDGTVVRGLHPISANIPPLREGRYAAHTRSANSYSIGVSACGMAGATENPFNPGRYPISERQFGKLAELIATLAKRYGIPVTDKTILTHAEVQPNLGIKQLGKWDYTRLVFKPELKGYREVGDYLRHLVKVAMR